MDRKIPFDYFSDYKKQPRSFKGRLSALRIWIKKGSHSFSLSVCFSLFFHSLLVLLCLISPDFSSSQSGTTHVMDADAFVEALKELQLGSIKDGSHVPLPKLSDEELLDAIERSKLPDLNLKKDERAEFYKKLIRAYLFLKDKKQRENPDAEVTLSDVLAYLEMDKAVSLIDDIFDWQSSRSSKNLLERLLKYHRWKKRGTTLPIA